MAHVPSLSSITSSELSAFVQREIEPDMAYIQRCNDIVDLLCQFMQNSFPRELRPSEVRKVNMAHSHFYWFCSNYHSSSFLICQCLNKIFKSSLKVYRMLSSYFYRQNKKLIQNLLRRSLLYGIFIIIIHVPLCIFSM